MVLTCRLFIYKLTAFEIKSLLARMSTLTLICFQRSVSNELESSMWWYLIGSHLSSRFPRFSFILIEVYSENNRVHFIGYKICKMYYICESHMPFAVDGIYVWYDFVDAMHFGVIKSLLLLTHRSPHESPTWSQVGVLLDISRLGFQKFDFD